MTGNVVHTIGFIFKGTNWWYNHIHFEEVNLLLESCNDAESGDKSDDNSTLPPLIIDAEIDEILSGNEYDAEPIPTNMLNDILDVSQ